MVETSDAELKRVRRLHQLRSYRIASVLRIGVVFLMVSAMLAGTNHSEWVQQSALILAYALAALWALALAYSPSRRIIVLRRFVRMARYEPFAFTAVDVFALT
ncbi:histidine kinase, partial [Mycobacterium kansasii]